MAAKSEKNVRSAVSRKRRKIAKTASTTASEISGSRSEPTPDEPG
jgi:hypothetical protein